MLESYSGYAELDNIARKVKETEEQLGRTEDDLAEAFQKDSRRPYKKLKAECSDSGAVCAGSQNISAAMWRLTDGQRGQMAAQVSHALRDMHVESEFIRKVISEKLLNDVRVLGRNEIVFQCYAKEMQFSIRAIYNPPVPS